MNSVCADCQNKGTFIHEFSIPSCSIIYPTGLHDKQKTALRQGVSCSINCVLPAGKSVNKSLFSLIIAIGNYANTVTVMIYSYCRTINPCNYMYVLGNFKVCSVRAVPRGKVFLVMQYNYIQIYCTTYCLLLLIVKLTKLKHSFIHYTQFVSRN